MKIFDGPKNIKDTEQKNNDLEINNINKEILSSKDYLIEILKKYQPEIIENFQIVEYSSSGGESIVYRGKSKKNNIDLIMKFIVLDNEAINFNEIIISNKLKNSNIINFYIFKEIIKNKLYLIVMEYAKFGDLINFLKKTIKKNYYSETTLCYITYQILNGLKYCHICSIAHLDLKPKNIVINDYLTVKIIDFSISIDYSILKTDKIKLKPRGTPFYMAPEVISNQTIDKKDLNKVDLFSIGVILYNLAFCTFPFELTYDDKDNYNKMYEKINNNKLKFDDTEFYSPSFIDFLQKLLEKDINKRININEAMNHHWIKAANILLKEKENIYNGGHFLINLVTDNYKSFNDYIYKEKYKN